MVDAVDEFDKFSVGLLAPAQKGEAVTPSDTVDLTLVSRALWVGVTGDVNILLEDDTVAKVFKNVPSGTLLPFRVKRVFSTSTTATDMVAVS